jgi:hypothetical protein
MSFICFVVLITRLFARSAQSDAWVERAQSDAWVERAQSDAWVEYCEQLDSVNKALFCFVKNDYTNAKQDGHKSD